MPLSAGEPAASRSAAVPTAAAEPLLAPVSGARQQRSGSVLALPRAAGRWRPPAQVAAALGPAGWPVVVYAASRMLLLAVAGVVTIAGHHPFARVVSGFDGRWYLRVAAYGYPTQALHTRSTLGFLPAYPVVLRAVAVLCVISLTRAALVTSVVGGLAAAMLAYRLASVWWGEQAARRATVVFCLFPGTVVFSMAYSECLTVPLALGCLLALHARRWWIAGLLAGAATAVEPVALVLIVVCLAAAARELARRGWRDPAARRSLAAPLLAPWGIAAVAVFLWAWTGTPFAAYIAQHYGWHEQSEPLALLALPIARHLMGHPHQLAAYLPAWNIWNGISGGIFLAWSLRALVAVRRELSSGTLVLTAGILAVTLWSVLTPPNARMVLLAFPAVLVWGRRLSGRKFAAFAAAETVLLVAMSALTFAGLMLP